MPLTGLSVLVINDDGEIVPTLRAAHADTRLVTDSATAMRSVLQRTPHVLLSDLTAAGMDACEFLREVRTFRPPDAMPAIALVDQSPALRQAAHVAGFQEDMMKPVAGPVMVARVKHWASRRAGRAPPTAER